MDPLGWDHVVSACGLSRFEPKVAPSRPRSARQRRHPDDQVLGPEQRGTARGVKCWGGANYGQLGRGNTAKVGDTKESLVFFPPIDLGEPAVAIGAGSFSVCALLQSGAVKCWGANGHGELGLGDTMTRGSLPGSMGKALPPVPLGEPAKAI